MKTVILASGLGSRLWPLSTPERPKQFLPLIDGESLLSYSYRQLSTVIAPDDLFIASLASLKPLVFEALPHLREDHAIFVPERRNTLPHTLYVLGAITDDPNEPVLFKSVDHFMPEPERFAKSLLQKIHNHQPSDSTITIFGVADADFDAGTGYCAVADDGRVLRVLEKPTRQEWENLIKRHQTLQLPLIFIATQAGMRQVISNLDQPWKQAAIDLLEANGNSRNDRLLAMQSQDLSGIFLNSAYMRAESIDYKFIDVGHFKAIYELNNKDENDNVVVGSAALAGNSRGNLIINRTPLPVVIHSLHDSVFIQTAAGSVVAPIELSDEIGSIYKSQILLSNS